MPTSVDIGNGYFIDFPDGMSREDINAAVHKTLGTKSKIPEAGATEARNPQPDVAPTPSIGDALTGGIGHGAFGLGDMAAAGADAVAGDKYSDALTKQRAARAAEYDAHPIASTIGNVAGSLVSGDAEVKAIGAIPGIGKAILPVAKQTGRNLLRAIGVGAAGGAAQSLGTGEDVGTGAAAGAIAGPVAAGAGKLAVAGVRKITSGADQGAVRAMAKRINEDPTKLDAAITDFKASTGRAPTLVEIVDAGSAEELARVADARISAADKFREAGDNIASERPASFSKKIASGGPTDTAAALSTARKDAMDNAMKPIAGKPVTLAKSELESFMDPDARSVLRQPLRAKIGEALEGGPPLTVQDLDNMRQAFSDAASSGQKHVFYDLAASARKMGARAVPEYGKALDEFERFSRRIKGFEHGQAGTIPNELTASGDIADAKTPEYAAGRNVGVRSRLVTKAAQSERGAVSTANDVLQGNTAAEMRGALNKGETSNIQAAGLAERQSADRLAQVSVRQRAPSDETADSVKNFVERGVAVGGNTLTGYKAHVLARLITKAHVSSATARRIAELATDPANASNVVAALRRAKLSDQAIRDILMPVSAATGAMAGGAQ